VVAADFGEFAGVSLMVGPWVPRRSETKPRATNDPAKRTVADGITPIGTLRLRNEWTNTTWDSIVVTRTTFW
jgi:hypothetical protein